MARLPLVLTAFVLAPPAFAHDYWLEPDSYFPAAGKEVVVRLHVGERFASEAERPFQKDRTVSFRLHSGKDVTDLAKSADDGKTPVARVTPRGAGGHLIALERRAQKIELAADKFNDYLKEEGLTEVLEQRRKAGEDRKPGRERYGRYLKCLVRSGDAADETYKKEVGHRLEIVPLDDPHRVKAGAALVVRVRFDGKPLAGAKLTAHRRDGDKVSTQSVVTSGEGTARVKLDGAGPWLLRLVHMRRGEDKAEADWESFWAAYSFGVKTE